MLNQFKNRDLVDRISRGQETPEVAVNFLMSQKSGVAPEWEHLKKEWDSNTHPAILRAKQMRVDNPDRQVPNIGLSDQERYTQRAIDLMFSKPVTREWETENPDGSIDKVKADIAKTIESVLLQNAYDSLNRERFVPYFASCQMAVVWESFQKTDRNGTPIKQKYGDKLSDYKIACKVYSPMNGDSIHPVYDDKGKLVLLGIGYSSMVYGTQESFFTILSSFGVQTFLTSDGSWVSANEGGNIVATEIGKIPGAFIERNAPVWRKTSGITYEKEHKIIDNGMLIDYNSVPDRVVKIEGDSQDEEMEALQIQMGIARRLPDGTVEIIPPEERKKKPSFSRNYMGKGISMAIQEWSGATDALQYHMKTLQDLQDNDIGLPDLAPNAIANIGEDTLRLILKVSALRVVTESGKAEHFMRREINVIKEHIKQMYPRSRWSIIDDLEFKVQINPFQITNDKEEVEISLLENGNMPLRSWESSVKKRLNPKEFKGNWEQLQEENRNQTQTEQGNLL